MPDQAQAQMDPITLDKMLANDQNYNSTNRPNCNTEKTYVRH